VINTSTLTGSNEIDQAPYYFFTPKKFKELPLEHQDQFLLLDESSTHAVYSGFNSRDMLCGDDGWGNKPFTGGSFKTIRRTEHWGDKDTIKKWLFDCGVPFKSEALILPVFKSDEDPAILTTWKMIVKYPDIFFESDNLVVCDPKLDWCLYYHHDVVMNFASGWDHRM